MPFVTLKQLPAIAISQANFKPYGELILPSPDGKVFDETDAKLQLDGGIPRFYIMHLERRGKIFAKITRHQRCTQCLGSLHGKDWYLVVCPPSESSEPNLSRLQAFHIPGNCFLKLNVGTWHAGPYFDHDSVDFYNLELSNTNVVDHFTHNFATQQRIEFEIVG